MNASDFLRNVSQNLTSSAGSLESASSYFSHTELLVVGVITGVFAFVGLIENLLIIFFIILSEGSLDVPANIFLLSLVTAEFLWCGAATPLLIYNLLFDWIFDLFFTASKFLALSAVGSIFLLTLNRFVSVQWALVYTITMSLRRTVSLVVAVWSLAFVLLLFIGISFITGVIWLGQLLKYFLALYSFLILAMNMYLHRKSRAHQRQIRAQIEAVTSQLNGILQQDFRSIKTLILVSGSFLLGWLPITLAALLTNRHDNQRLFYRAITFAVPFIVLNAALDPVIYFFRSDQFQRTFCRFKRQLYSKLGLNYAPASSTAFVIHDRVHPI